MRLGEGTGAILAMNIMRSALRAFQEMATFEEAGVSGRESKRPYPKKMEK
jgi:nicotinate-nucleotide--dimethylbenzimidazole phosphoribosyltransferase